MRLHWSHSAAPVKITRLDMTHGQPKDEVFGELLGLSGEARGQRQAERVIY